MPRVGLAMFVLAACSTPALMPVDAGEEDAGGDAMDARRMFPEAMPPPPESGILVTGPALLSQTGLYADIGSRTVAQGITEFSPRWSLWSDGATKRRWIQLPQGQKIETSATDQWIFPVGTKLWKEFKVSATVVETRFLWKQGEGWPYWWMGAYRWRQDGTDAEYVEKGEVNALGTTHDVPSQVSCVRCHNGVADVGLGFSAIQLSAPANSQLAMFAGAGVFTNPPTQEFDAPGQGVVHDALAYLHANCGHCHTETSTVYEKQTKMVLRLRVSDATPEQTGAYGAIAIMAKHEYPTGSSAIIAPGNPAASQLFARMNIRDDGKWQMPPICTKEIDTQAANTIASWITQLPAPDM